MHVRTASSRNCEIAYRQFAMMLPPTCYAVTRLCQWVLPVQVKSLGVCAMNPVAQCGQPFGPCTAAWNDAGLDSGVPSENAQPQCPDTTLCQDG